MSYHNQSTDRCPYCNEQAYSFFNGEYEEYVDECKCNTEQRCFIDAQCRRPQSHNTDSCDCIPKPKRDNYEALDVDPVRVRPAGPDGWGCSSIERTMFSRSKRLGSRIRKDVRRRVEMCSFASA